MRIETILLHDQPVSLPQVYIPSFSGPQRYNSEALPFTYGQYVVIELADKLYNSVTVCFCATRKYAFHIGLKRELNVD